VIITQDLERVKCVHNRKEDVTDSGTSGYPTNSKLIQMQKKSNQNDKIIAEWLLQRQQKKIHDKII
jgi:hypothetical protein